jgi:hypothetical protein
VKNPKPRGNHPDRAFSLAPPLENASLRTPSSPIRMSFRVLASLLCLALALLAPARAQFGSPEEMATEAKIEALIEKIREKAAAGPLTAEKLAPELAELDQHMADFAGHKEQVARFAFTKAMIHVEFLNDATRGEQLLLAIKRDYPDTEAAQQVDEVLAFLKKSTQRNAVSAELQPVLAQIQTKFKAGKRAAADYAPEIAKLDALVAKFAKNPEAAAHVAFIKASLYLHALRDTGQALKQFAAVKTAYPDTLAAESAVEVIAQIDEDESATDDDEK